MFMAIIIRPRNIDTYMIYIINYSLYSDLKIAIGTIFKMLK